MPATDASETRWRDGTPVITALIVSPAALAVAASVAFAQAANIVGLGAAKCRDFNRDVETNFRIQRDYFAWAQGFMSGIRDCQGVADLRSLGLTGRH